MNSKTVRQVVAGQRSASLVSIQALTKLCNHPCLIYNECLCADGKKSTSSLQSKKKHTDGDSARFRHLSGLSDLFPARFGVKGINPEFSGKMNFVYRLVKSMVRTTDDRLVMLMIVLSLTARKMPPPRNGEGKDHGIFDCRLFCAVDWSERKDLFLLTILWGSKPLALQNQFVCTAVGPTK